MNLIKFHHVFRRSICTTGIWYKTCVPNPCSLVPKPEYGPPPVHRAEFLNGMKVACANPFGGDIASCTIMFQVGSSHEFDDSLGVSHFIRAASYTSGLAHSGFMRSRYLQQTGGYITCNSDRQTISFTLRCPEPAFAELGCFLTDAAARCQYPDHELGAVRKLIRADLERRPKDQHVMDLVQKACFRGPYSNSVYCEEGRIKRIDSDVINQFVGSYFKTNVCTIASVGVKYGETMKVASSLDCNRQDKANVFCLPLSYPKGGYEFYDTGRGETYIAFAVPGTGTCDVNCFLKHAILAAACGIGCTHRGGDLFDCTQHSPLGRLAEEENDMFTSYRAFNISYLHGGCFGILVRTRSDTAKCAGYKASEFLGNICQISVDQIRVGKKRLKLGMMLNDDTCERFSESLTLQLANNVACDKSVDLASLVDSIPDEEVILVANCISNKRCCGQLATAVVGDVEAAPHDAELRCG